MYVVSYVCCSVDCDGFHSVCRQLNQANLLCLIMNEAKKSFEIKHFKIYSVIWTQILIVHIKHPRMLNRIILKLCMSSSIANLMMHLSCSSREYGGDIG